MYLKIFQKGFNYSQDGPGNRLVFHLQGCNLRCPWCSNPESICHGNPKAYTVSIADILNEASSSSMMFFDGGGVTFTGGEPTLQFLPLKELLALLKENGINTALETNGTCPKFDELIPLLDTVMIDFKHYNPEKMKQIAGEDTSVVLQNIGLLSKSGTPSIIRIPLINGFNASAGDAAAFAKVLSPFNSDNISVEFLPYHEYGKDKWAQSGMEYTMKNAFIGGDTMAVFKEAFNRNGFKIIKT